MKSWWRNSNRVSGRRCASNLQPRRCRHNSSNSYVRVLTKWLRIAFHDERRDGQSSVSAMARSSSASASRMSPSARRCECRLQSNSFLSWHGLDEAVERGFIWFTRIDRAGATPGRFRPARAGTACRSQTPFEFPRHRCCPRSPAPKAERRNPARAFHGVVLHHGPQALTELRVQVMQNNFLEDELEQFNLAVAGDEP